jgi:alkylated DNA nucleotide flippase Atl1
MDTFSEICRRLTICRGRQSAITLADLASLIGCARREVEQVIEQRLSDFPWPIVSGATGLYIPQEADDINQYLHALHSRHRRMQLREATVRRKARLAGYPEAAGQFLDRQRIQQQELFA